MVRGAPAVVRAQTARLLQGIHRDDCMSLSNLSEHLWIIDCKRQSLYHGRIENASGPSALEEP